jgi:mannose-6-phosphate isomerase
MTIELAAVKAVPKPGGRTDLHPWGTLENSSSPIGELWFGRADPTAPEPALLLKLLFTAQPLSIQVHPDDDYAHSMGLPHGKTEAWYVVSADRGAKIALGLQQSLTPAKLRAAIEAGSLPDLVHWQHVVAGDAVLVPAGTIHAIGAGLMIAEIQQRSDATFRLFDYARHRALQVEAAIGAAVAGPATQQARPAWLSTARRLLALCRYFVLEQIALPPDSRWALTAEGEAWFLALEGNGEFDGLPALLGAAVFIEGETVGLRAGSAGLKGLIAYAASVPLPELLRRCDDQATEDVPSRFTEPQELPT